MNSASSVPGRELPKHTHLVQVFKSKHWTPDADIADLDGGLGKELGLNL